MKFFRNIKRYFRDARKSVFRNFSLSLASVSCITITLLVVAFSVILSYNVENFSESIRNDFTVVIFLKSDTTEKQIKEVEKQIKATNNVETLDFVTKNEMINKYGNDEKLGKYINTLNPENTPFLDSYQLKVKDIEIIKETVDKIKKIDEVDSINYGEDMIEELIPVFNVIEKASIIIVIALILVTAFLIGNTIKLAIFSRKREIEIMRLVGSSNISIKIPFVIEGLFIGVLGSAIPIILSVYGYISLYKYFDGKLFGSNLAKLVAPTPFIYYTALVLLLIGIMVGMFGSYRAVKKYLKI